MAKRIKKVYIVKLNGQVWTSKAFRLTLEQATEQAIKARQAGYGMAYVELAE